MAKKVSLVLALTLFSLGAYAMFWPFQKYDVEMSSEVRGVIKLDGVPQSGLTISRELFYEGYKKGQTILEETQTNEQGEFSFPAMTIRSRLPGDIFGQNFHVNQFLFVRWKNNKLKLWGATLPTQGGKEVSDMLSTISCELTNVPRIHEVETSSDKRLPISVHSICDWNVGHITTYIYDEKTDSYVLKKESSDLI
ncbi:DUF4198 domain-containing protein [Vibrio vulnificus]|uniref:DUF4198 domain-containing protein n=1 Tax=Vibrio vulnificus TaxID=672 RepID=UPI001CDD7186|nr:DUF4198 domain-containing protein [Vibrio vulnificus]MCU8164212.1 DUF4198 domain-containing protein [Vibrio vulnificus]MCU8169001.1 DUF4198 domain-containing protein [Vibrio vulnificus]MCU8218820.1 DUF4198 domain-containing protein [Vibrio vulnificus]MCU8287839.1 DUF4198 domain-containing protein [Vibrio vulnificus]MCU8423491.1 DUF4198 domain-containing protein [Vibrio vulnificus]